MSAPASDDSAAPAPQKWYHGLLRPWSLPARVACFVACVLFSIVVIAWINSRWNSQHVAWRLTQPWYQQLLVFLLMVGIPVAVYQALRMWFQSESSPFPDLDSAWRAGRDELRRQGIDLNDRPVYLVLGSTGESMERAFLEGAADGKIVRGIPTGDSPLRWYVDSQRVFLCCSDAGWMSAVARLLDLRGRGRGNRRAGGDQSPEMPDVDGYGRSSATIRPGAFLPNQGFGAAMLGESATGPGMSTSQSISLENFMAFQPAEAAPISGSPVAGDQRDDQEIEDETPAIVPSSDARLQQERLEAICNLMKAARFPYCPVNGCLMLLPFAAASASDTEIEEISKAVNADLMTAQATLQIRFPVIAVFTGLQAEPGFRELMRRVGPEKSKASRFGMGYDLRAPASSPEMDSFASHVCGVFEDWVYGLFREDQVLKRPGNSPLFALLCRVRSGFKSRLARILSNGFGYSERTDPEQAPYFFSGCYFVATGNSADQRAFTGGILEKIDGEQDRLEWNSAAVREDQSVRRLGLVATIAALLLALLFPILVFKDSLFAKTADPQADSRQSQAGERGASSAESAPRTGKPIDGSPTDDSKRSPEGK